MMVKFDKTLQLYPKKSEIQCCFSGRNRFFIFI